MLCRKSKNLVSFTNTRVVSLRVQTTRLAGTSISRLRRLPLAKSDS